MSEGPLMLLISSQNLILFVSDIIIVVLEGLMGKELIFNLGTYIFMKQDNSQKK
jgi:hypothetical protein